MTTHTRFRHVVNDGGLDDWLAERRRLGQDGRDEVWDGVYHVVPHARSNHGKLAEVPFYLARGVGEVWVVTPHARTVRLLVGTDDDAAGSDTLGVSLADVHSALGWD